MLGDKWVSPSGNEFPYWWAWERWHRRALKQYPRAKELWREQLLPLEQEWLNQWDSIPDADASAFSARCFSDSLERLAQVMEQLPEGRYPGLLYAWHWRQRDLNSSLINIEH